MTVPHNRVLHTLNLLADITRGDMILNYKDTPRLTGHCITLTL